MQRHVEVFADVLCPFAHVGLKRVAAAVAVMENAPSVHVRAWPLEWVNAGPLDGESVATKAEALRRDLGVNDFSGLTIEHWPSTTIGALNLTAVAYEKSQTQGLEMALAVRAAVFEQGQDISEPAVLEALAQSSGFQIAASDIAEPHASISRDFEEGQSMGVGGSPTFVVGSEHFFCPSLEISKTADGALGAVFDTEGFSNLISAIASG